MWAGGHGASDELSPRFAVESELGVQAIAQAEGIDERQRNHGRGDVAYVARCPSYRRKTSQLEAPRLGATQYRGPSHGSRWIAV